MRENDGRWMSPGAVSLFGKVPSALDFVRIAHQHPESMALERWLLAGQQRLAGRGRSFSPEPVRFVLAPVSGVGAGLFGVVVGSRDRAGRTFPLVVYGRCPLGELRCATTALLAGSEAFCEAVEQVLAEQVDAELTSLLSALQGLTPPGPRELRLHDAQLAAWLRATGFRAFAQSLPEGAGSDRAAEGVPLGLQVLDDLSTDKTTSGQSFDAFECPVARITDGLVWTRWLELSQGRYASCLYQLGKGGPRWLVCGGPFAERVWLYWSQPNGRYPQLQRVGRGRQDSSMQRAMLGEASIQQVFDQRLRMGGRPGLV